MTIRVLENACVGCGSCVPVCPTEALSVWGLSKCDPDLCNDCLDCVPYCPVDALME
ncbi:MAG: 4Fe-4S binding protein [Dehalococcoidia bacterium]|nr:4Fe-4S binding protein [Dehalococcoidia bacterium]